MIHSVENANQKLFMRFPFMAYSIMAPAKNENSSYVNSWHFELFKVLAKRLSKTQLKLLFFFLGKSERKIRTI